MPSDREPVSSAEFIPVQAEDVERERRKKLLFIWSAIVLVILAVAYIYKLRTDPIEARQAFDAGERLMRAQRYNEAANSFTQTIGRDPSLIEAYYLRGRAYANLFMWDKAIADFTTLAQKQPKDARAYLFRGQAWIERKEVDKAFADAAKAIECDPNMTEAYNLQGVALHLKGDTTGAMRDFDKAIKLQPNADNYTQRGMLYMELGQHAKAEADFTLAIQFIPDASHPYFARAAARRAQGNEAGAKADHKMARHLDGSR